jgi:hypothetical protein
VSEQAELMLLRCRNIMVSRRFEHVMGMSCFWAVSVM